MLRMYESLCLSEKNASKVSPTFAIFLQSETDFPEIPSEFRISRNCLSLSDQPSLHPHVEKLYSSWDIWCLRFQLNQMSMEPSSKVRSISDSKWELWSLSFSVFRAELRLYPTNHIKPSLMHSLWCCQKNNWILKDRVLADITHLILHWATGCRISNSCDIFSRRTSVWLIWHILNN